LHIRGFWLEVATVWQFQPSMLVAAMGDLLVINHHSGQ